MWNMRDKLSCGKHAISGSFSSALFRFRIWTHLKSLEWGTFICTMTSLGEICVLKPYLCCRCLYLGSTPVFFERQPLQHASIFSKNHFLRFLLVCYYLHQKSSLPESDVDHVLDWIWQFVCMRDLWLGLCIFYSFYILRILSKLWELW